MTIITEPKRSEVQVAAYAAWDADRLYMLEKKNSFNEPWEDPSVRRRYREMARAVMMRDRERSHDIGAGPSGRKSGTDVESWQGISQEQFAKMQELISERDRLRKIVNASPSDAERDVVETAVDWEAASESVCRPKVQSELPYTRRRSMIATLRFRLPEEASEHACAVYGPRLASVIHHIRSHLRNELKYGEHDEKTTEHLQRIADMIREHCAGLPDEVMD